MHSEINVSDKIKIYFSTMIKVLRGLFVKLRLGKSSGLTFVGRKVSITHSKKIKCGKNVKFEDFSEIHGLCSEGLIFGDNVTIGRNVMIRPSSYYGRDYGRGLSIGDNSSIGPDSYVGCSGKITIGKNVMFGPKCSLFAENHVFNDTNLDIKNQGVVQKGITISDDCWIASNVIILDGVTIGRGVVVAAGSIVTKDIPDYSVAMGSPAKIVRSR